MTSSALEQVKSGARILIDAPIFIYHFTGTSAQCRDFLCRCEDGDVEGVTSVVTLAEVTHRLMAIEAVVKELVSPGNVVKKLRKKPEIVRKLSLYQEQVEQILRMEVDVVPVDLPILAGAATLRKDHGLLTNDSLIAATAHAIHAQAIASADQDFARLDDLDFFSPDDVAW